MASNTTDKNAAAKRLGQTIKQRRKQFGLTQEEMAQLAQISTRTWGDLERGRGTVRLDMLTTALEVLGLELTTREQNSAAQD